MHKLCLIIIFAVITLVGFAPQVLAQTRIAVLTSSQGDTPAGTYDGAFASLLTVGLREQDIQLVERDQLEAWMDEQALSVAGLVRRPVRLGEVLGATHLLVIETRVGAFEHKAGFSLVEVDSGNMVAQKVLPFDDESDLGVLVRPFVIAVPGAIEREAQLKDRPTAVVLSVMDMSPHLRTQHYEPVIRGLLEASLAESGYRVLKRDMPDLLKEETLLSASGLVRADAAVLAQAAERVVSARFVELTDPNTVAKDTPIKLVIDVQVGQQLQRRELTFTPATEGTLQESVAEVVSQSFDDKAELLPTPDRAKEADKLMAEVRRIENASPKDFLERRIELCLEVLYLDPGRHEAYWYLTQSYWPLAMQSFGNRPLQRELIDKHVEVLERYLAGPREDIRLVTRAYNALVRNAYERQLGKDVDENKRIAIYEKALAQGEEYVRWVTERGYDRKVSIAYGCLLPTGDGFARWFRSVPGREPAFFEWTIAMHRDNKSKFPKHAIAMLHKRAVDAYRHAGDDKAAAQHYYMQTVGCGYKPSWSGGRTLTGSNWDHPRDLEKLLSNMKSDQADQVRAVLDSIARRLAPPPIQQMYGDFYGDIDELDRISLREYPILLEKADYPVLQVEPAAAPKGVVWTGFIETTEAGLWLQGYGYDHDKGGITSDDLYRLDAEGQWQTIVLPPVYGPHPNLQQWKRDIASLVQIGDDVLWAHSTHSINGGGSRPVELEDSLYHYKLSTGEYRLLGLKDGMPHPQVRCMRRGLGKLSDNIYIHTHKHFICRFEDGKLFIEDMRLKKDIWPQGMAIHDRASFFFENGASELWHANPETNHFKKITEYSTGQQLIGLPWYFYGRGGGGRGTQYRIAIVGDKVYSGNNMGLLVTDLDGNVKQFWRHTRFFHFNELGGYVLGNSPLPSVGISLIMPDDQNPDILWLVGQSPRRVASVSPDWQDLKARGHDTGDLRIIHQQPHVAKERENRGVYITAFDTKRQLFSKPKFVKGPIVSVRPHGDRLFFTGADFGTLAKTHWPCDQPGQPDEEGFRVSVPDTLHGRASEALMKGDVDKARELLKEAKERGIAVEVTNKALSALRNK